MLRTEHCPHRAITPSWQARANLGLKNQVFPKQRWQVLRGVPTAGLGRQPFPGEGSPFSMERMPASTLSREAVLSNTPCQLGLPSKHPKAYQLPWQCRAIPPVRWPAGLAGRGVGHLAVTEKLRCLYCSPAHWAQPQSCGFPCSRVSAHLLSRDS